MRIESPAFKNNGDIPRKYTCDGEGIHPPFLFRDVPHNALSLAFIMEDPDVPRSLRSDGMFDHWVVWNISPETSAVEEGVLPSGIFGISTNGARKYVGPCPPDGRHRYFFRLFALDTELSLPIGSNKRDLISAMEGHIVGQAELIGLYDRIQ